MTLSAYLRAVGVSPAFEEMGNVGYANTLCSHGDLLPVLETADLEQVWAPEDAEDEDIKIDGSVRLVIEHLARGANIVPGWVARRIEVLGAPGGRCRVTSVAGDVVECRAVVCAVPISAYKRRAIAFSPPLDPRRLDLCDRINFEPAMKVFLRFTRPFWPSDAMGMICMRTPVPEFWFQPRMPAHSSDAARAQGNDYPQFVVTAFACSAAARKLSGLAPEALVETMLAQLDTIFGTEGCSALDRGGGVFFLAFF
jgi:monoamine oxidase